MTDSSGSTSIGTGGTGTGTGHADQKHTAGAFDIRNVIGGLLLVYGVTLTVAGIGGSHDNLWTGLALLVVGGSFIAWAQLKPTVVPDSVTPEEMDPRA